MLEPTILKMYCKNILDKRSLLNRERRVCLKCRLSNLLQFCVELSTYLGTGSPCHRATTLHHGKKKEKNAHIK